MKDNIIDFKVKRSEIKGDFSAATELRAIADKIESGILPGYYFIWFEADGEPNAMYYANNGMAKLALSGMLSAHDGRLAADVYETHSG